MAHMHAGRLRTSRGIVGSERVGVFEHGGDSLRERMCSLLAAIGACEQAHLERVGVDQCVEHISRIIVQADDFGDTIAQFVAGLRRPHRRSST